MKNQEISLSVVIPAYNESTRIGKTLRPTIDYFKVNDIAAEILVVSDGSSDGTRQTAEPFISDFPGLSVIEYFPNRGKGYAVKTGMLAANGKRILFMDADYAVPIETIAKAHAIIDQGFDIAIGSRKAAGADKVCRQAPLREMASQLYAALQNRWIKVDFSDTQCGFKMFTREAAQALFSQQKLSSVIFDGEILFLAQRAGLKTGEFPVLWHHDPDSRITYNLRKSIQIIIELFNVRWLHRFGR